MCVCEVEVAREKCRNSKVGTHDEDEKKHVYNEYGAVKGLTFKDHERCVDQ